MGGIRVDQLTSCMVDFVIHGNPKKVIEHQELIAGGKVLLANKAQKHYNRESHEGTPIGLGANIHSCLLQTKYQPSPENQNTAAAF